MECASITLLTPASKILAVSAHCILISHGGVGAGDISLSNDHHGFEARFNGDGFRGAARRLGVEGCVVAVYRTHLTRVATNNGSMDTVLDHIESNADKPVPAEAEQAEQSEEQVVRILSPSISPSQITIHSQRASNATIAESSSRTRRWLATTRRRRGTLLSRNPQRKSSHSQSKRRQSVCSSSRQKWTKSARCRQKRTRKTIRGMSSSEYSAER